MHAAFAYRKQHQYWLWQSLAKRMRVASSGYTRLQDRRTNLVQRLVKTMRAGQAQLLARVDNIERHLILLDPTKVLARGYSLVRDANGGVVFDGGRLTVGTKLQITFAKGWARTEVKERGAGRSSKKNGEG
jgi:exodeoxyribonuclease VII large subunit